LPQRVDTAEARGIENPERARETGPVFAEQRVENAVAGDAARAVTDVDDHLPPGGVELSSGHPGPRFVPGRPDHQESPFGVPGDDVFITPFDGEPRLRAREVGVAARRRRPEVVGDHVGAAVAEETSPVPGPGADLDDA
jgi:hypothetical protein